MTGGRGITTPAAGAADAGAATMAHSSTNSARTDLRRDGIGIPSANNRQALARLASKPASVERGWPASAEIGRHWVAGRAQPIVSALDAPQPAPQTAAARTTSAEG